MKRTHKQALYVLITVAIAGLVVYANISRRNKPLQGLRIDISYDEAPVLLTEATLEQQLLAEMPWIMGEKVKDLDIKKVQQFVSQTPYVEQCQASISVGRKLVLRIKPRRPIMRVFYDDYEFYIDAVGRYVPLSEEGNANVIVANGEFKERLTENRASLDVAALATDSTKYHYDIVGIYQVAAYLDQHPEYGAFFDQIYIDADGDLFLTPKLGKHIVKLGDSQDLDRKFRHLWALYTEGLPQTGWDTYSVINLKYNNQVIGKKRK